MELGNDARNGRGCWPFEPGTRVRILKRFAPGANIKLERVIIFE